MPCPLSLMTQKFLSFNEALVKSSFRNLYGHLNSQAPFPQHSQKTKPSGKAPKKGPLFIYMQSTICYTKIAVLVCYHKLVGLMCFALIVYTPFCSCIGKCMSLCITHHLYKTLKDCPGLFHIPV